MDTPRDPLADLPSWSPLAAALVREFHRATPRRRSVERQVYVGAPGIEVRPLALAPWLDAGARSDLVARAVAGIAATEPLLLWVARTGENEPREADRVWLPAAHEGFARHTLTPLATLLVTRHGWSDLGGRWSRSWQRVRPTAGPDPRSASQSAQVWTGSLECIRAT